MRHLLAAFALLLSACPPNPDEILRLRGTVNGSDTVTPLDGVTVEVLRSSDGNCTDALPWKESASADGGQWAVQFFRGEIQPPYASAETVFGTQRCVSSRAHFGAKAYTEFRNLDFHPLTVAPLMFEWKTEIALDAGVVVFSPLLPPAELAKIDAHQTVFIDGVLHEVHLAIGGQEVWESSDLVFDFGQSMDVNLDMTPTFRVPMTVPSELLEDFEGELSLRARAYRPIRFPTSSVDQNNAYSILVNHVPEKVLKVKGARVPLSRGRACEPLAMPCPLTDGALDRIDFDGGVNGLVFHLAAPAQLQSIVIRDVNVDVVVAQPQLDLMDDAGTVLQTVTADQALGDSYTRVFFQDNLPPYNTGVPFPDTATSLEWTLDGGVTASNVRLTFGAPITHASELSLFGP